MRRHWTSAWIFALALYVWIACAQAGQAPTETESPPSVRTEMLVDEDGSLTIADVVSGSPAQRFEPMNGPLALGFTRATIWIRLTVLTEQAQTRWLEIDHALLDSAQFFDQDAQGRWQSHLPSSAQDSLGRHPASRHPVFELHLPAQTSQVYYLRLQSQTSMSVGLHLWRPQDLMGSMGMETFFWGLISGAYVLVIVFYAMFWLWTRERLHLYYALYIFSNFMASFLTGAWHHTLGIPLSTSQHITVLGLFICLPVLLANLFSTEYVRSHEYWPRLTRIYIGLCALLVAVGIGMVMSGHYRNAALTIQSFSIGLIVFNTVVLIYLTRQGNRAARLMLWAFSIFHLGIAWRYLRNIGILAPNVWNDNAYQIGAFIHMMVMSTGIFSSYNQLRQQSEKQRARANAEASLRQRQKHFLSMVSHEVRTPLTVIAASADNLQLTPGLTDTVRNRVEKIIRNASKIRQIIQNFLDNEQLLNSSTPPALRPLDLATFSQTIVREFQENHPIAVTIQARPGQYVQGDSELLAIALNNLLDNAKKYAPATNPIEISVETQATHTVVSVSDCGSGVTDEDLPHLFDAYYRGQNVNREQGSGLGLHLVQHIAQQHHGFVTADRNPSGGMRFALHLPTWDATGHSSVHQNHLR